MSDEAAAKAVREAWDTFLKAAEAAREAGLSVVVAGRYAGRLTKESWSPFDLERASLTVTKTL